jgi:hypothetical protein
MKIYVIHDEEHKYLPNTRWGNWSKDVTHAKKYVSRPAMLRRLGRLVVESPSTYEFYYEIFDMVSKGSTTLTFQARKEKMDKIKKNMTNDNP